MGTESIGVLYLDGKPLCLTKIPKIKFNSYMDEKDVTSALSRDRSCSYTATFKYSKMSRKRFVCCLIKHGYSKKNAKRLSTYYNKKRIPYSKANILIRLGLSMR